MATAPPMPKLTREQIVRYVKFGAGALATAVLGGLFAAIFTYYATARLNTESSLQQQYLVAIQDFSATGAQLDASITELADTVLDGAELTESRRAARQAIAAHAAATQSLSQVVGQGNVDEYAKGLATLRILVDDTGDRTGALKTSRARFDLMDNRVIMIKEARKRVYD
jgi:hypothetical protein